MAPSRQTDNRNVFLLFQDLSSPFTWSVSRPAEVQPWEVRFAHPCRARARHPIHKAMGGHASHGRASDRAFITFQFRVGTIKILWPRTPISRLLFNSIMVQLERRYPEYDFEHFVQFQFHKGAIRTLARRYSLCSYEKSTNFSYVKFSFTYRSVLLSTDSFHQFIWCKYLHL